ncbi:MAG TPA: dihydropteroate synthase [Acidothermaceae bacterium]
MTEVEFPYVVGFPELHRCRVMGVLNVTPDSFSDGGRFFDHARAIEHGLELFAMGVDIVDVGGESTRPGALRVDPAEELRRVLPVVTALTRAGAVSIDTMNSEVARRAVDAGAILVNDVSGGLADSKMASFVAAAGVAYVVMHWRGHSVDMQTRAQYSDVVADVRRELSERIDAVVSDGVAMEQIVLDPGIGFAKKPGAGHNWALLKHLDAVASLGRPVLVGASRKAFLGHLLAVDGAPRPAERRDHASAAVTALVAAAGAWGVRVHAPAPDVDAVRVAARWRAQP